MGKYLNNRKGITQRKIDILKPKRLVLIVTEGEKTEKIYFNWLRKQLNLAALNIEIIPVGADPLTVANIAIKHNLDVEYDSNPYTQPSEGDGSIGRICKKKLKAKYYPNYDESNQKVLNEFFDMKCNRENRDLAIKRAQLILDRGINNDNTINPSTMLFIPIIDIELMANPDADFTLVSQERYERYLKDFFKIFIEQNL